MKAPEHETVVFGKDGSYKIVKKNFWLVSAHRDAYGKQICEGDIIRDHSVMFTYVVEFDGNAFVMVDPLGTAEGNLTDFDSYNLEIIGHVTEKKENYGDDDY